MQDTIRLFVTNAFVGCHYLAPPYWDTLNGLFCGTFLCDTFVGPSVLTRFSDFCTTLMRDTVVAHFSRAPCVRHVL